MRARWLIVSSLLLVLAAAAAAAWWLLRAVPVLVAPAVQGSVAVLVTGPGTVQARVPVTVSARLTSTISDIAVDVGDVVQRGQVLATLESSELAAKEAAVRRQQDALARQVDAAAASVAKARADYDLAPVREHRDADLHAQGFVSLASLDASTAATRGADAALRNAQATWAARRAEQAALAQELVVARTQRGYTRLVAPMPGIVIQRLAEAGTTVGPATPILRLVDPRTLWVATRVDEALVERVAVGQGATIRLRSGTTVRGRVERLSLQSDTATRELDVHVSFAGAPPRVAIDQEAEVRIEAGREEGLVLPVGAILRDAAGAAGVLQVVAGRARLRPVQLGPESDGLVLVRSGLSAGDVVVAQAAAARAGMRVQPQSREAAAGGVAWNSR